MKQLLIALTLVVAFAAPAMADTFAALSVAAEFPPIPPGAFGR